MYSRELRRSGHTRSRSARKQTLCLSSRGQQTKQTESVHEQQPQSGAEMKTEVAKKRPHSVNWDFHMLVSDFLIRPLKLMAMAMAEWSEQWYHSWKRLKTGDWKREKRYTVIHTCIGVLCIIMGAKWMEPEVTQPSQSSESSPYKNWLHIICITATDIWRIPITRYREVGWQSKCKGKMANLVRICLWWRSERAIPCTWIPWACTVSSRLTQNPARGV